VEADGRLESTEERLVDVAAPVGGQDHETAEGLDPLQQVGNLLVGVLVVGVEDVARLPKSASVSLMYFDTTRERSTRKTGSAAGFATSSWTR
jgi:hypothetical protein